MICLSDIVNCLVKIFADDIKAYSTVDSPDQANKLQNSINSLVSWTKDRQIEFNGERCKVLHFGKNNPKHVYNMNAHALVEDTVLKDLGIYVDTALKFESHISDTVKKAIN